MITASRDSLQPKESVSSTNYVPTGSGIERALVTDDAASNDSGVCIASARSPYSIPVDSRIKKHIPADFGNNKPTFMDDAANIDSVGCIASAESSYQTVGNSIPADFGIEEPTYTDGAAGSDSEESVAKSNAKTAENWELNRPIMLWFATDSLQINDSQSADQSKARVELQNNYEQAFIIFYFTEKYSSSRIQEATTY